MNDDQADLRIEDLDLAFFNKYRGLPEDVKKKIQQIVDIWSQENV
jgi:hypothetical protein